jgi:hypothetical protein
MRLFPNDFYQHTLSAPAVEFTVKNLFPRPEIELAFGYADDYLAAHHLAFEMSIGVVFAGPVVLVLGSGRMRGQFFQPNFVIMVEPAFIVVDKNGGCAVRCHFVTCKSRPYEAYILTDGNQPKHALSHPRH